jgi:hypothetical protein
MDYTTTKIEYNSGLEWITQQQQLNTTPGLNELYNNKSRMHTLSVLN